MTASIALNDDAVMEGLMKIGVAGAGAVGCHYAGKLIRAGFDVVLLARGEHLRVLQSDGLRHESDGQVYQLHVDASDDTSCLAACDVVVLTCKMTGLAGLLHAMQGVIPDRCLLVTLQNGVQAADMVSEALPGRAVVAGTAFIGARMVAPGHVLHSAAGGLRMGLWQEGRGSSLLPSFVDAIAGSGIPVGLDADPALMLWRKMLWNCGFNAITAITRRYAHEIAGRADTLQLVRDAMQETVAVAKAVGVVLNETDIANYIDVTLALGPVKTSMWQDLESGRATEVDFINGYIASTAASLGLAAPVNRTLTTLIHAGRLKSD